MTTTFESTLEVKLPVKFADQCVSELQQEERVKFSTRGITKAVWTSNPKQKRLTPTIGDYGCVQFYLQSKERLLELFCIFPLACLISRVGGGRGPNFSTKNTFLKSVQQAKGLSL